MNKTPFACARGGLTIRGDMYRASDEPMEAVILCHGFGVNRKSVSHFAEYISTLGFACFAFDFCGGGLGVESDGDSADMTVFTEIEDLLAVISYVSAQKNIKNVSLLGCSQGGFVSALTAKKLGNERIKRLMLFFPALCIPDHARRGQMLSYRFDSRCIPDRLGDDPMPLGGDYARTVAGMDAYKEISGYTGQTLIIHGTADDIVDISYARRARSCYPGCAYHEIEGAGHGFWGEQNAEAKRYIASFLYQN